MAARFLPESGALRSKVLVGFGIVSVMLVVIASISVFSTRSFIGTSKYVVAAQEQLELMERLLRRIMEMESSRRGFLVTGNESFLRGYEAAQTEVIQSYNALEPLNSGTDRQAKRLARLKELLNRSFAQQGAEIEARRGPNGEAAAAALFGARDSERITSEIRALMIEAQGEQRELLAMRSTTTEERGGATTFAVLAGGLLTIVALLAACALILRDLTARRRAEQALAQEHNLLSSIINAMPAHVFVKDVKGRYILDNSAHRQYLREEGTHAVEGKMARDYYAPATAKRYEEDDRLVMGEGQPIVNKEDPSLLKTPGSVEKWLETTRLPLRDTDGKIVGLVGISRDISERKEAQEQLKSFASQLERSNAELQSFASVASHDLQEPLRKIQAFGDRLLAKCGPQMTDQCRDYLARMQNAAERMQVLIQDLLKLSRVTSRAQPFQVCDLSEIVGAVLSDLEVAVERTGAQVKVDPLPVIDADPLQMRQLFQNLISNALKFHKPDQPPGVTIGCQIADALDYPVPGAKPGDKVCRITVADNGIGFDEKFADQIFVVFQRLHTREEYEGTGIGLAVCRKITDRHGGSIAASSVIGEGATFAITLPVKQPQMPNE